MISEASTSPIRMASRTLLMESLHELRLVVERLRASTPGGQALADAARSRRERRWPPPRCCCPAGGKMFSSTAGLPFAVTTV